MTITQRISSFLGISKRSSGQSTLLSRPADWLVEVFGLPVRSGAVVSQSTADSVTAYNWAVRVLSESVGKLPFNVYRLEENGRVKLSGNSVDRLLNLRPNSQQTPITFYGRMVTALMKKGNAYYFIDRDNQGNVKQLIDLNSTNVRPFQTIIEGERITMYDVKGFDLPLYASDIFHIVGWGDNPICGKNPIQVHAETLGISLSTVETKGAVYGNLGNISGVLESDKKIEPDQKRQIANGWREQYVQSKNAGKIAILSEGFKFKPIQMSPADSKILEAEDFQIDEIARITGVPPHKLFKLTASTMNNMEVMNSGFVETVDTICVKIEQEARAKLFAPQDQLNHIVRADLYELSRGDMKSRAEYWHKMLQDGVVMINEAREAEGFVKTESGNVFYRPLNMMLVDQDGNVKYDGSSQEPMARG